MEEISKRHEQYSLMNDNIDLEKMYYNYSIILNKINYNYKNLLNLYDIYLVWENIVAFLLNMHPIITTTECDYIDNGGAMNLYGN